MFVDGLNGGRRSFFEQFNCIFEIFGVPKLHLWFHDFVSAWVYHSYVIDDRNLVLHFLNFSS